MKFPDDLQTGDILLYFTSQSIFNQVIVWKESDERLPVAHVEIYAGDGKSWASRDGLGVALYDYRQDGLQVVRRPNGVFDAAKAQEAFAKLDGLPYGWCDIMTNAGITEDLIQKWGLKGIDCSDFASILQEEAGTPQFDLTMPKSEINPRDFKLSLASTQIHP